jgi:hypothetical protein
MGGVRRHTEGDDLVIGAVLVELWRSVATIAVYNKKPIDSSFCVYGYRPFQPLCFA